MPCTGTPVKHGLVDEKQGHTINTIHYCQFICTNLYISELNHPLGDIISTTILFLNKPLLISYAKHALLFKFFMYIKITSIITRNIKNNISPL